MTLTAVPGFARAFALPFAFLATSALASGGTITLTDGNTEDNPLTYTGGPYFQPTSQLGCDPTLAPCDVTTLKVNVSPAVAATHRVVVDVSWAEPIQSDFDLFVTQGANSIAASASTTDPEVARFEPKNGDYTVDVEPYQPFFNSINVKIYLEQLPAITPATAGPAARFQVYPPPAALVSKASGGEPSIGTNTKTGSTVVGNSSTALFVTWNDATSPAQDTWASRPPRTDVVSFDPILFTDRETGLTVASQLVSDVVAFTAGCSLSSVTYDDGVTWIPAEGCGLPSGADHQGIGGGPFHAPIPTVPQAPGAPIGIVQHAVYYCAQSFSGVLGDAVCARSDNGGLTYGPSVVVYTSECGGLHGHPRVSPEGTVYLPNKDCAGTASLGQGVVISKDNGLTWTFSIIPGSTPTESDPSVATGLNGTGLPQGQAHNTVYFGYCDGDGHPKVSVSRDEGTSFSSGVDVGASAGIKNCVFPEMIAGDDNRASFFFIGTTRGGGFQAADFTGEWHAYVATTYDGGASWGLYDATPNDPVQMGCIWMQGGSNACRNLLDFNDIALDAVGRPNFVYADGCIPPACISGSAPSTSHKAVETIGRQSGGKTLFSQYDNDPTLGGRIVPAAPKLLSATSAADGITVTWAAPDDGGSPITAYSIYRSTTTGQETLFRTISGNKPQFTDGTTVTGTTYFYKVSAVNANGEGAKFGEVSAAGQTVANAAPSASLTPASATINAGQSVDFTVDGRDTDAGDTLSYDLDFGDGTAHGAASGPVSHTYTTAGHYTATLTVTDSHSATGTASSSITVNAVTVNHAPTASLTPPSSTIDAGQAVSFTVSGTDPDSGDTLSYDLNFGDGSAHSAASGAVSHTYTTAGSYTATLTVSDGHGGSDTKTSAITVQQPNSGGTFSVTLTSDKVGGDVSSGPVTVTFTAHVSNDDGSPLQYTFAFGDGATSTMTTGANTISHAYAYAGTYHPYVTVTEDYGAKAAASGQDEDVITTTTSVTVEGGAAAHLTYSLPNGNVAPVDVAFDTSGSTGDSYSVDFGDGAVDTHAGTPPATITHRYLAPGSYTVTLSMSDGQRTVSDTQTVQIVATQQLTAELQVTPTHGTSPLAVTLDGCHSIAANDGSKIASFTMDFGDGSAPVTQTVDATHVVDCSATDRGADPSLFTHTYTAKGTFVPTLTVTDDSATPRTAQAKALGGVSVQPKKVAASGGGAFGLLTLLPLLGAGALRRRRKMPA